MMKAPTFVVIDRVMGLAWGTSAAVTGREAIEEVMGPSLRSGYTCKREDFVAVGYREV